MSPDPLRRAALAAGFGGLLTGALGACVNLPLPSAPAPAEPGAEGLPPPGPLPEEAPVPPVPREFRAAWVATVANIDWPSQPGLSAQVQREQALAILDRAHRLGLNAIVLQVRPACDALYPSTLEPWSEVLSGVQGQPPWHAGEAPWDPLAFWLHEARRRGLELHAWLNPYRARHSSARSPLAAAHLALRRPDLVKPYGDMLWMDPGEPDAAAHTLAVVADLLRRYDVDGVHIDDYFYPYPVKQGEADLPFPDEPAWARFRLYGGLLTREDWRRANVDELVQALYRTARDIRPTVRVGISPFGLGRPDRRPAGITGFSQYDQLYADVERWLENGWLDYLAPQLYWPIDRVGQQFPVLLDYWLGQNPAGRHIWPGMFTSRITRGEPLGPQSWPASELQQQVQILRSRPAASGHIHFSMVALMQDRDGIASALQAGPYAQPALVPATPWLAQAPPPAAPRLQAAGGRVQIEPAAASATGTADTRWAVWRQHGSGWRFAVLPGGARELDPAGATRVAVAAVDRVGQNSAWQVLTGFGE